MRRSQVTMRKNGYRLLLTISLAAAGLVAGFVTGVTEQPQAAWAASCDSDGGYRTCPYRAQTCVLNGCDVTDALSFPNLACSTGDSFEVETTLDALCDTCVASVLVELWQYPGAGMLASDTITNPTNGSSTTLCVSAIPTHVVFRWNGTAGCNYQTKGLAEWHVETCCSDCEPE